MGVLLSCVSCVCAFLLMLDWVGDTVEFSMIVFVDLGTGMVRVFSLRCTTLAGACVIPTWYICQEKASQGVSLSGIPLSLPLSSAGASCCVCLDPFVVT